MVYQPELENGINLIIDKGDKGPVLHKLTYYKALNGSTALWIDSDNQGSSYRIASYGGKEAMENIEIARAFTTYQHYTLIQSLEAHVKKDTEIIVASSIDHLYRKGQLGEEESIELLEQALKHLKRVSNRLGLKALITVTEEKGRPYEIIREHTDKQVEPGEIPLDQKKHFNSYEYQTTIPQWIKKPEEIRKVIQNRKNQ